MSDLFVTRRREIKYLVDAGQMAAFADCASNLLVADTHGDGGSYVNHSIYFDSPNYTFYAEKREGLRQRVKPRLRLYRSAVDGEPEAMFLELKHRDGPFVAKQRTAVGQDLAQSLLSGDGLAADDESGGVLSTFAYLNRRFDLRPAVAVLYHRSAFSCPHHPRLRVTYDRRLQWSRSWAFDAGPAAFATTEAATRGLIEIKYDGIPPGWLLDTMASLDLQPQSYSKYASALEAAHAGRRRWSA